jgi:hypothetical protein
MRGTNSRDQEVTIHPEVLLISSLIIVLFLVSYPFFLYQVVRVGYRFSIDYNEGWNVIHTSGLLNGEFLYSPINALPIKPVLYPPLSFIITGAISYLTGEFLVTGRLVALLAFLFVGYLIFRIIAHVTPSKLSASLGALVWLTLVIRMAGHYVGMYDPQMLAHVFSVAAFYLYHKWDCKITTDRSWMLALLCCSALFTKHLLVSVPVAITLDLFFRNRKAFWHFVLAGTVIFSLLLAATWLYWGDYFVTDFLALLNRPTSQTSSLEASRDLFLVGHLWVLFLAFFVLLLQRESKWLPLSIYFCFSFVLGCYTIGGEGADRNYWFDFFIAASIVFGVVAATGSVPFPMPKSVSWLGVGTILAALVANEFVVASYVSGDGVLEPITVAGIRCMQIALVAIGISLVRRREVACLVKSWIGCSAMRMIHSRILIWLALIPVIVPFSINLKADAGELLNFRDLEKREDGHRRSRIMLRSIAGPALFEDLLLGSDSAKELLFDPFDGSRLIAAGRVREEVLADPIRNKYFSVIVLKFDLDQWLDKYRSGKTSTGSHFVMPSMLELMAKNYELLYATPGYHAFFYIPRR